MEGDGSCPPYEAIKRLRILREYRKAFHAATGLSLMLVPAGPSTNAFSRRVRRGARGQQQSGPAVLLDGCDAARAELAVPVVIDGKHAATLLVGNALRRKPTPPTLGVVMKLPSRARNSVGRVPETKTGVADLHDPVISDQRMRGAARLAVLFAQQLIECAERWSTAHHDREPACVIAAKRFVEQHIEAELTLATVARQVHLNAQYFCRQFRKATGLCFTEYVSRLRVQHARRLLADPSKRITEVAYASGFQSIPHFNRVFKKYAGTSPTAFRVSQGT